MFFGFCLPPPMSHSAGRPLIRGLTMFRLCEPPYMSQSSLLATLGCSLLPLSPAPERPDRAPTSTTVPSTAAVIAPASQRRNVGYAFMVINLLCARLGIRVVAPPVRRAT